MKYNRVYFLFVSVLVSSLALVKSGPNHGRKLIKDLLKDYEPYERPVASESDAVDVRYGIAILKTYGVCPKDQALKSKVWLRMYWNDVNLRWNRSDYGRTKIIILT